MGHVFAIRAHTREAHPGDSLHPFIGASYVRRRFRRTDSKCDVSNAVFGQIRQATKGSGQRDLIFLYFLFYRPIKEGGLIIAAGAWPKSKPRGGGSAVSKGVLFCRPKTNRPPRGVKWPKIASAWLGWAYLAKKNAARRNHAHRNRLQNLC